MTLDTTLNLERNAGSLEELESSLLSFETKEHTKGADIQTGSSRVSQELVVGAMTVMLLFAAPTAEHFQIVHNPQVIQDDLLAAVESSALILPCLIQDAIKADAISKGNNFENKIDGLDLLAEREIISAYRDTAKFLINSQKKKVVL